jgi:phosphate transport system permease protein
MNPSTASACCSIAWACCLLPGHGPGPVRAGLDPADPGLQGRGALNLGLFTENTPAGRCRRRPDQCHRRLADDGRPGTLISTPIGILAGIYLAEYGEESKLAQVTRFVNDIMLSAPSIVIGLFVYAMYVANVKHFSGWAGHRAGADRHPGGGAHHRQHAALVPNSLREAAFALGAPRWKVAIMVRLRAVKAGVVTGVLLAVARISGETAPLLFTALNNQFFSTNMNRRWPTCRW